jgi:malonyl-CoA decarboxylase
MRLPTLLGRLIATGLRRGASGTRRAESLCHALLSERGEAAGTALARETLDACESLDDADRARLFDALARDFSPDPERVARAAEAYRRDPSATNQVQLQAAVEAPRQELFRRLNMAPGGTTALVALRRKLLGALPQHPEWVAVDADLLHLLRSWFNRGFLVLKRIDWRSSAIVLEKLIQYEAVHEIKGWPDLHRRLESDRRCFAFFHPALPDEPLIFIEVALTRGMAGRVQPLLDVGAPLGDTQRARCATFYSITNCQEGLRGVSFGNFLIKQVAEELRRELPQLRVFATLSPIPGFTQWLRGQKQPGLERLGQRGWHEAKDSDALAAQLMPLCARYLVQAKRGDDPLDPVARFHMGNGARLERINWLADTSSAGIESSAGMMANYVYRLDQVEHNHELFVNEHRVIASRQIERLLREGLAEEHRTVSANA